MERRKQLRSRKLGRIPLYSIIFSPWCCCMSIKPPAHAEFVDDCNSTNTLSSFLPPHLTSPIFMALVPRDDLAKKKVRKMHQVDCPASSNVCKNQSELASSSA